MNNNKLIPSLKNIRSLVFNLNVRDKFEERYKENILKDIDKLIAELEDKK